MRGGGCHHTAYLLRLAELELLERERRMIERRIREAHFPAHIALGLGLASASVLGALHRTHAHPMSSSILHLLAVLYLQSGVSKNHRPGDKGNGR